MLTFVKQIFVWWNQDTIGTKLYTIFFGRLVGKDDFGNKYYENKKKTKRWVIYLGIKNIVVKKKPLIVFYSTGNVLNGTDQRWK